MAEKIVLVTAGGHISSFHAAMKSMYAPGFELFGGRGGLEGLVKGELIPINLSHIEEDRAGSLPGADRWKIKDEDFEEIERVAREQNVYAIIMMGGDNHLGEADRMRKKTGLKIVGYPKTMDGDISSFISLGWPTAVTVGATQTRNHHVNAMTYSRIFYVGLFGRDKDWVVSPVALYGGADRAIPCEQDLDFDFVFSKIEQSLKENRERFGREFAVVPYAEGARIKGVSEPPKEHCSYDTHKLLKLLPEWLGMELVRLTKARGKDAAFQAHTYDMRDSPPTEEDKWLSSMAGRECIQMILDADFGKCAAFTPENGFYRAIRKPLEEVAVKRSLMPTGFFDYSELRPTQSFRDDYDNLFIPSLGLPSRKEDLVYKNMLPSAN